MPDLPQSWGLRTEKRTDGKLDIIGKTDAGEEYKVRTTDGSAVTDRDISELRDADRENYTGLSRREAAKRYVDKIVAHGGKIRSDRETEFGESLIEPAGEVMFAALDRKGHSSPFTGSTRAYRRGWETAFGKEN